MSLSLNEEYAELTEQIVSSRFKWNGIPLQLAEWQTYRVMGKQPSLLSGWPLTLQVITNRPIELLQPSWDNWGTCVLTKQCTHQILVVAPEHSNSSTRNPPAPKPYITLTADQGTCHQNLTENGHWSPPETKYSNVLKFKTPFLPPNPFS